LKKNNSVIATKDKVLFKKPTSFAKPVAQIKEGRLLIIEKCEQNWCKITSEEKKAVLNLGGLYVIGTERHESRRIDNQLRGRSGRQGDPGESRFYISLEDDLMRRFQGERIQSIMDKLKLPDNERIEQNMVTKSIERAQAQVES